MVERQLPKLNVVGSSPITRFLVIEPKTIGINNPVSELCGGLDVQIANLGNQRHVGFRLGSGSKQGWTDLTGLID